MLSRPLPLEKNQIVGMAIDDVVVSTILVWAKHVSRRRVRLDFFRNEVGTLTCEVYAADPLRASDFSPLASTEVSR